MKQNLVILLLCLVGCASQRPIYTCPVGELCFDSGLARRMSDDEWNEQVQMIEQHKEDYNKRIADQESQVRTHEAQQVQEMQERKSFFKKGQCYMTFPLHYVVNQKIDQNHYGAVTALESPEAMYLNRHAVIEMTNFNPKLKGYLNTTVEFLGTKDISLENGFSGKADILKQTKCQLNKSGL